MTLAARIAALVQLGEHLSRATDEFLQASIKRTRIHNPWFTEANQWQAIGAIAEEFLQQEKLAAWIDPYNLSEPRTPRRIGLVMAGNLPLVGFHDLLCVFVSGHRAVIKLSEKDPYLLPALLRSLYQIDPRTEDYFEVVERLQDFDAVIATGSNNSSRYFEAYFGRYPHIIRANRNGVAVLDGTESEDELRALGQDVFAYFGLGCRNVAKLYLPQGYKFEPLLEALHTYNEIILHPKYKNNFDYNYALLVLNKEPFRANGCLLLREQSSIQSPIACLHYEYYTDQEQLCRELNTRANEIQVVTTQLSLDLAVPSFPLGQAQRPRLQDYADGVDTLAFLRELA
ncbi:MAG: acyl-CoA reductase [Bacteroidetes bacterium]|nr:MAG: acyl-CoA reductase [Bacteroidota bacterium]